MEQANVFLEGMFLGDLNRRYAIAAREGQDLHRPVEAGLVCEEVLCVQEQRVVGQDWCVRWRSRWLQIDSRHASLNLPRKRVLVKHRADGQLIVQYQGERLTCRELAAKPAPAKQKKVPRRVIVNNRQWKPAKTHPWKQAAAGRPPRDCEVERQVTVDSAGVPRTPMT